MACVNSAHAPRLDASHGNAHPVQDVVGHRSLHGGPASYSPGVLAHGPAGHAGQDGREMRPAHLLPPGATAHERLARQPGAARWAGVRGAVRRPGGHSGIPPRAPLCLFKAAGLYGVEGKLGWGGAVWDGVGAMRLVCGLARQWQALRDMQRKVARAWRLCWSLSAGTPLLHTAGSRSQLAAAWPCPTMPPAAAAALWGDGRTEQHRPCA